MARVAVKSQVKIDNLETLNFQHQLNSVRHLRKSNIKQISNRSNHRQDIIDESSFDVRWKWRRKHHFLEYNTKYKLVSTDARDVEQKSSITKSPVELRLQLEDNHKMIAQISNKKVRNLLDIKENSTQSNSLTQMSNWLTLAPKSKLNSSLNSAAHKKMNLQIANGMKLFACLAILCQLSSLLQATELEPRIHLQPQLQLQSQSQPQPQSAHQDYRQTSAGHQIEAITLIAPESNSPVDEDSRHEVRFVQTQPFEFPTAEATSESSVGQEHDLLAELIQSTGSIKDANSLLDSLINDKIKRPDGSIRPTLTFEAHSPDYEQVKPSADSSDGSIASDSQQSFVRVLMHEPEASDINSTRVEPTTQTVGPLIMSDAHSFELLKGQSEQAKSVKLLDEIIEATAKGSMVSNYKIHYDDEHQQLPSPGIGEQPNESRVKQNEHLNSSLVVAASNTEPKFKGLTSDEDGLNNNESISSLIMRNPSRKLIANYSHWINHEHVHRLKPAQLPTKTNLMNSTELSPIDNKQPAENSPVAMTRPQGDFVSPVAHNFTSSSVKPRRKNSNKKSKRAKKISKTTEMPKLPQSTLKRSFEDQSEFAAPYATGDEFVLSVSSQQEKIISRPSDEGQQKAKISINNLNDESDKMRLGKKNETGVHKIVFVNSMPQWTAARLSSTTPAMNISKFTEMADFAESPRPSEDLSRDSPRNLSSATEAYVELSVFAETETPDPLLVPTTTTLAPTSIEVTPDPQVVYETYDTFASSQGEIPETTVSTTTVTSRPSSIKIKSKNSSQLSSSSKRNKSRKSSRPKVDKVNDQHETLQSISSTTTTIAKMMNSTSVGLRLPVDPMTTEPPAFIDTVTSETVEKRQSSSGRSAKSMNLVHLLLGTTRLSDVLPEGHKNSKIFSLLVNQPDTRPSIEGEDAIKNINLTNIAPFDGKSGLSTVLPAAPTGSYLEGARISERWQAVELPLHEHSTSIPRRHQQDRNNKKNQTKHQNLASNKTKTEQSPTRSEKRLDFQGSTFGSTRRHINGTSNKRPTDRHTQESIRRSTVTTSTFSPLNEETTDYSQTQLVLPTTTMSLPPSGQSTRPIQSLGFHHSIEPTTLTTPEPTVAPLAKNQLRIPGIISQADHSQARPIEQRANYNKSKQTRANMKQKSFKPSDSSKEQVTRVHHQVGDTITIRAPLLSSQNSTVDQANPNHHPTDDQPSSYIDGKVEHIDHIEGNLPDIAKESQQHGNKRSNLANPQTKSTLLSPLYGKRITEQTYWQDSSGNATLESRLEGLGDPMGAVQPDNGWKYRESSSTIKLDSLTPENSQSSGEPSRPIKDLTDESRDFVSTELVVTTPPTILNIKPINADPNQGTTRMSLDNLTTRQIPYDVSDVRTTRANVSDAFVSSAYDEMTTTPNWPTTKMSPDIVVKTQPTETQRSSKWFDSNPSDLLPSVLFHNRLSNLFQYKVTNRTKQLDESSKETDGSSTPASYYRFEYQTRDPKFTRTSSSDETLKSEPTQPSDNLPLGQTANKLNLEFEGVKPSRAFNSKPHVQFGINGDASLTTKAQQNTGESVGHEKFLTNKEPEGYAKFTSPNTTDTLNLLTRNVNRYRIARRDKHKQWTSVSTSTTKAKDDLDLSSTPTTSSPTKRPTLAIQGQSTQQQARVSLRFTTEEGGKSIDRHSDIKVNDTDGSLDNRNHQRQHEDSRSTGPYAKDSTIYSSTTAATDHQIVSRFRHQPSNSIVKSQESIASVDMRNHTVKNSLKYTDGLHLNVKFSQQEPSNGSTDSKIHSISNESQKANSSSSPLNVYVKQVQSHDSGATDSRWIRPQVLGNISDTSAPRKRRREPPVLRPTPADEKISVRGLEVSTDDTTPSSTLLSTLAGQGPTSKSPGTFEKQSEPMNRGNLFARLPMTPSDPSIAISESNLSNDQTSTESILSSTTENNLTTLPMSTLATTTSEPRTNQHKTRRELVKAIKIDGDELVLEMKLKRPVSSNGNEDELSAIEHMLVDGSQNWKSTSLSPLVDEYRAKSLLRTMINLGVPGSLINGSVSPNSTSSNSAELEKKPNELTEIMSINKPTRTTEPVSGQPVYSTTRIMATTVDEPTTTNMSTTLTTNAPITTITTVETTKQTNLVSNGSRWRSPLGETNLRPATHDKNRRNLRITTTTAEPILLSTTTTEKVLNLQTSPTNELTTESAITTIPTTIHGPSSEEQNYEITQTSTIGPEIHIETTNVTSMSANSGRVTNTEATVISLPISTTTVTPLKSSLITQSPTNPTTYGYTESSSQSIEDLMHDYNEYKGDITSDNIFNVPTTKAPKTDFGSFKVDVLHASSGLQNSAQKPIIREAKTKQTKFIDSGSITNPYEPPLVDSPIKKIQIFGPSSNQNQLRNQRHSYESIDSELESLNPPVIRISTPISQNNHSVPFLFTEAKRLSSVQRYTIVAIGFCSALIVVCLLVIAITIKCRSSFTKRQMNANLDRRILEQRKNLKRNRLQKMAPLGSTIGNPNMHLVSGNDFYNDNQLCSSTESTASICISSSSDGMNIDGQNEHQNQTRKFTNQLKAHRPTHASRHQSSKSTSEGYFKSNIQHRNPDSARIDDRHYRGSTLRQRISGTISNSLLRLHLPRLLPYFAVDYAQQQQQTANNRRYVDQKNVSLSDLFNYQNQSSDRILSGHEPEQGNFQMRATVGDQSHPNRRLQNKPNVIPKPKSKHLAPENTFDHHKGSRSHQHKKQHPQTSSSHLKTQCNCPSCTSSSWLYKDSNHSQSHARHQHCATHYNPSSRSKLPFGTASSVLRQNEPDLVDISYCNEAVGHLTTGNHLINQNQPHRSSAQQPQTNNITGRYLAPPMPNTRRHRLHSEDSRIDNISIPQSQMDNEHHMLIDNEPLEMVPRTAYWQNQSNANHYGESQVEPEVQPRRPQRSSSHYGVTGTHFVLRPDLSEEADASRSKIQDNLILEEEEDDEDEGSGESDNYYNVTSQVNYEGHPTFQVEETNHSKLNEQQKFVGSRSMVSNNSQQTQSTNTNVPIKQNHHLHQIDKQNPSNCNCNLILYPL